MLLSCDIYWIISSTEKSVHTPKSVSLNYLFFFSSHVSIEKKTQINVDGFHAFFFIFVYIKNIKYIMISVPEEMVAFSFFSIFYFVNIFFCDVFIKQNKNTSNKVCFWKSFKKCITLERDRMKRMEIRISLKIKIGCFSSFSWILSYK